MCTAGLVCNQTYEDNEMMKKLLLCSNNCQDDNDVDEDDADVIVESLQEKSHSLKSFCNEVESLENLNFNYEVIVKFVKQGNNQSPVCSYNCDKTRPQCQSALSGLFWNARLRD